jgi:hypothetical protein
MMLHHDVGTTRRLGLSPQASALPLKIVLEVQGVELQILPGADARHQGCCQDQTWSQLWSQNGMVAGYPFSRRCW